MLVRCVPVQETRQNHRTTLLAQATLQTQTVHLKLDAAATHVSRSNQPPTKLVQDLPNQVFNSRQRLMDGWSWSWSWTWCWSGCWSGCLRSCWTGCWTGCLRSRWTGCWTGRLRSTGCWTGRLRSCWTGCWAGCLSSCWSGCLRSCWSGCLRSTWSRCWRCCIAFVQGDRINGNVSCITATPDAFELKRNCSAFVTAEVHFGCLPFCRGFGLLSRHRQLWTVHTCGDCCHEQCACGSTVHAVLELEVST